ncbi:Flp pilus assembly protein CpaB [Thiomicrorhabdus aquaedulcis]|uniref:Flp pilus assembly protein CpaB n=1 Tax=Thiomicrorhabdus aquaedulcis TaxID=2211106 RepID=UPI000FDCC5C4|nr:Flp pilus assembly protein CpaB [Thiomicrorhabdus aquaedulcis]
MKFQRSDVVLYGVALLSAVLAMGLVYGYVESRVASAEAKVKTEIKTITVVEKPELKGIVVANRDVYRGEKIEADDIKLLMVPTEGVVTTGVLTDVTTVVGHVAKQDIFAGEWLLEQKLGMQEETQSNVLALLEKGMRAIRIPVSAESGLLGMLNPSDHVDVISVFESPDGKRMISRTILQNIEVLSIGQVDRMGKQTVEVQKESQQNQQGEAFVKASMVALNVNVEQAEKLALAMNIGAFHLVLRGAADVDLVETNGVSVQSMAGEQQRPPIYKAKQDRDVIQIMQGGQVEEVRTR